MICADSAVIARSACANVSRLGGWPVIRCLSKGSSSAGASGLRARIRRNNPSSVGVALTWFKGSFRLSVRLLPPGFREIARQSSGTWPFYPIPACDPLLLNVKQGNSVEARHEGPVQRPHRGDESRMLAGFQRGRDHDVDGGVLGAHIVPRALKVRGLAAPIE